MTHSFQWIQGALGIIVALGMTLLNLFLTVALVAEMVLAG